MAPELRRALTSSIIQLIAYTAVVVMLYANLSNKVEAQGKDILTIKKILCEQATKDSFCKREP